MAATPMPTATTPSQRGSWDKTRRRELALIHIAKTHFALNRDDYEYVLQHATGTRKTSAADLTNPERNAVLKHFKRMGFVVGTPPGGQKPLSDPQYRKLRAMWYALADAGAVGRPDNALRCDQDIEAWAKRQLANSPLGSLDALRFVTGEQLNKLVEEMKRWGLRVHAHID